MSGNEWKLPLNFAIGFHLVVLLSAFYLPGIIDRKPQFEDIYTVNLVNLEDVAAPEPQVEEAAPVETKQPEIVPDNAVSIAPPAPEPVAAPPKAISIKPLKKKKKKKVVEPPKKKSNLEAIKRQKLAEMIRAQQLADEQARILAQEAELERKILEETRRKPATASPAVKKPTGRTGGSSGGKQVNSAIAIQYYTAIRSRLMSLWSLPEYKVWDPSLNALVVITIQKNGVIADSFFEQKSGDRVFDSFVTKTLQEVGTLPPIPSAMKKQRLEIGLRFTPGQIH